MAAFLLYLWPNGNSPYLTLQISESENEEAIAEEENKDTDVYDEDAKE